METPLTAEQAAKHLGISRRTLVNWVRRGMVACTITPTGRYRFTVAELDQALQRQEKTQ